jgi:hypothetical protein
VQEFALSPILEMWCDMRLIDLHTITIFLMVIDVDERLKLSIDLSATYPFWLSTRIWSMVGGGETYFPSLEVLLHLMVGFHRATDPRDYVYGLLGIIHGDSAKDLEPDYRLSVAEVYINTIKSISNSGIFFFNIMANVGCDREESLMASLPS